MVDGIREEDESGGPGATPVARRSLLRAAGLGAAVVGLGAAAPAAAAAEDRSVAPAGAARRPDALNSVNLYCSADAGTYMGGGTATVQVTIGNFSGTAATGPVSLKVITPFYANVATLPSVSDGTSREPRELHLLHPLLHPDPHHRPPTRPHHALREQRPAAPSVYRLSYRLSVPRGSAPSDRRAPPPSASPT